MILGLEGLKNLQADVNLRDMTLTTISSASQPKLNHIVGEEKYRQEIDRMMKENNGIGPLPFTTTIEATIRTKNEDPIWTNQYPYPIADNEFVNKEMTV
ncbi:hypothetical protein EVAR_68161_1 [Eumeta japonica]|uniref:Uncharacterized protein n=1 Tax=Eumeta variegata TaxID=151549 RepID=A0A4C1SQU6_EUMVA|nr:hypothetical protein EVAR_68161_1 [Eumeta japonica]